MASVFSTWNIILRKVICFWCVLMDVCDYACMFVRVHMCMQVHRHTRTCMPQGQRSTLGVLPQKSPVVFPKAEFPISLSPAKLTGLAAQSVPGGSPYICPSGLPFLNKGSGDWTQEVRVASSLPTEFIISFHKQCVFKINFQRQNMNPPGRKWWHAFVPFLVVIGIWG